MNVKQISARRFPSGDSYTIAMLKYEPEEISALYSLHFQEDRDDLDYFVFAAFENPQIGQVLLLKYKNGQVNGTEVLVDSKVSVAAGLQAIQSTLDLKPDDIIWVCPQG